MSSMRLRGERSTRSVVVGVAVVDAMTKAMIGTTSRDVGAVAGTTTDEAAKTTEIEIDIVTVGTMTMIIDAADATTTTTTIHGIAVMTSTAVIAIIIIEDIARGRDPGPDHRPRDPSATTATVIETANPTDHPIIALPHPHRHLHVERLAQRKKRKQKK